MKEAAEVGDVEQAVLDGHGAAGAMHRLLEGELAVAVGVEAGIVPDGCRVGVGPGHFSLFLDHCLLAAAGQGFRGVGE